MTKWIVCAVVGVVLMIISLAIDENSPIYMLVFIAGALIMCLGAIGIRMVA